MLSNPSEITDEPSPSWRAIEDTGAGDGLPTECERCGKPGHSAAAVSAHGSDHLLRLRRRACCRAGVRRKLGLADYADLAWIGGTIGAFSPAPRNPIAVESPESVALQRNGKGHLKDYLRAPALTGLGTQGMESAWLFPLQGRASRPSAALHLNKLSVQDWAASLISLKPETRITSRVILARAN